MDPKWVCIAGASYGGYAAIASVTRRHGIYRCAASFGGMSAGKLVEFVRLDGEDHWLSASAMGLQMLNAVVAFVENYDPPDGRAHRLLIQTRKNQSATS